MNTSEPSRQPSPDPAERDAFFPSPYSLSQFTSETTDLSGADYPDARRDGRWKVLMIAADERYLPTANGHLFSTGNHPVETLLPMYHLHKAGFEIDVATLSGNPVAVAAGEPGCCNRAADCSATARHCAAGRCFRTDGCCRLE